jgi:glycosyltransferase involved in cell wall biosynthesis
VFLITIIVPVFNHWHLMPVFFESIINQTLSSERWQLIVVDNGSSNVPNAKDLPSFVTLLSCETPGSYAARNLGLQYAKGELIVFTDADCKPDIDWLESYWNAFKKYGNKNILAGSVKVTKLSPGILNDYELFDSFLGIPQERYVTRRGYAVTANLAVPRFIFDIAGIFDGKRFSGGDAEFCQRAQKVGATLSYVPQAKILHPARSSWVELKIKAQRVKGGQLCNGPFSRRVLFFFKSFIFPIITIFRILHSSFIFSEKIRMLRVASCLGFVEVKEVFLLLLGKRPERK